MTFQRQPSRDDDLIRFRCVCGKRLKAPRKHAGKPAKCSCGASPLIPEDEKSADDALVASEWYWRDSDSRKEIGPLPESAMRKLLASGAVIRSTLVRRADSDVWAPAESWWEGFSEDRNPDKRERSSIQAPDRDEIPLAAPTPGLAPVVQIIRQPSRTKSKKQSAIISVGRILLSGMIYGIVVIWTLIILSSIYSEVRNGFRGIGSDSMSLDRFSFSYYTILGKCLAWVILCVPALFAAKIVRGR